MVRKPNFIACFGLLFIALAGIVLPPYRALADDGQKLFYYATLSYSGTVNEKKVVAFDVMYYKGEDLWKWNQNDTITTIRIAPGDKISVELKDPGKVHHIGTWQALVKWELNTFRPQPDTLRGGSEPRWEEAPQNVVRAKKLGDGDWIKILVLAKTPKINRPHQFSPDSATKDLGFFYDAGTVAVDGSVDRHFPPDNDFVNKRKNGNVTGSKQEVATYPSKGVWYEVKIIIERTTSP